MSRIVDEPYFTYSAYSALTTGIQVKCPKCHGAGVVTADDENAYFRCLSCGHRETRDLSLIHIFTEPTDSLTSFTDREPNKIYTQIDRPW